STLTEVHADILAAKTIILHHDIHNTAIAIESDAITSVSYINRHRGFQTPSLSTDCQVFLLWCWEERRSDVRGSSSTGCTEQDCRQAEPQFSGRRSRI